MNLRPVVTILFMLSLAVVVTGQAPPNPPVARIDPKVTILHNEKLVDNYHWLREKTNPRSGATSRRRTPTPRRASPIPPRSATRSTGRCSGRIKETDLTVPWRYHGYWYYSRTEKGKNYPIYCRKKGSLDAREEVILDQNSWPRGRSFTRSAASTSAPTGSLLLYLEDTTAFREYTLHVKDLRSGALLPGSIPNVWNGTAWADDNRTFFYTRADSAKRPHEIWRHALGTTPREDVKVFQEDSVLYNAAVSRSRSGSYVFIGSEGFRSSEWRVVPAARPTETPRMLVPRAPDVLYTPDHVRGRFLSY